MKDFCKKEQVFFNTGEKLDFMSERGKNHYHLYRQSFNESTTKYIKGSQAKLELVSSE